MMPQLISILSIVAPSSIDMIKQLSDYKMKDKDIMIVLLAINIENNKRLCTIEEGVKQIRREQI
jgi:hypothetical protein